jgi:hypothetical protein
MPVLRPLLSFAAAAAVLAVVARSAGAAGPDWSRAAVIDCLEGRVFYFERPPAGRPFGPARAVELSRIAALESPDVPALAEAERCRDQGRFDEAAELYRFVIAECAARRAPSWAAVVARARRLERAADLGDAAEAIDQWLELRRLRPEAALGFLPGRLDGWEPEGFNRAVRRLQDEVFRADTVAGGEPAAALDRLHCALPRPRYGPGFFGVAPRANRTTVFVVDWPSFSPAGRAAVRRELLSAIYRLRAEAGQSFAVIGVDEPAAIRSATLSEKHAFARRFASVEPGVGDFAELIGRAVSLPEPKTLVLATTGECAARIGELRAAGVSATAVNFAALPTVPANPGEDEFPSPPDEATIAFDRRRAALDVDQGRAADADDAAGPSFFPRELGRGAEFGIATLGRSTIRRTRGR